MGPLLRNQAVTTTIAAAFSFTLNTNLNTTPSQLISGPYGIHLCSCPCVQILCSNHSRGFGNRRVSPKTNNDESKENNSRNAFSFAQPYTSHLYRFRFNRAYIKPEPNQNQHHWHCLWKGKTKCNHYFLPDLCGKYEKNRSEIWFIT